MKKDNNSEEIDRLLAGSARTLVSINNTLDGSPKGAPVSEEQINASITSAIDYFLHTKKTYTAFVRSSSEKINLLDEYNKKEMKYLRRAIYVNFIAIFMLLAGVKIATADGAEISASFFGIAISGINTNEIIFGYLAFLFIIIFGILWSKSKEKTIDMSDNQRMAAIILNNVEEIEEIGSPMMEKFHLVYTKWGSRKPYIEQRLQELQKRFQELLDYNAEQYIEIEIEKYFQTFDHRKKRTNSVELWFARGLLILSTITAFALILRREDNSANIIGGIDLMVISIFILSLAACWVIMLALRRYINQPGKSADSAN